MERLALLLAVGSLIVQLASGQEAFLAKSLPLTVLVTTPSELASDAAEAQAVTLTGRQAVTAVFNRPVIALGSDWGSEQLPDNLVPFKLSCGTPGRLRWVTTNIARFDPSIDWPTDLDCRFEWNRALKTYDGAALQLDGLPPSVRLQTQPLTMTVQQVQSAAAMAATGGQWSASLGSPDDQLPEVPPDGNITLSLSYPVELAQLAKSLKLAGAGAGSRTLTVSPCPAATLTPLPLPLIFTAYGAVEGEGQSRTDLLALNGTCAVVKIVPGLDAGASAVLRLPKGARYSRVAGPASQDIGVNVYGLRPFRIPLRWDFQNKTEPAEQVYNGITYRRLTMWLPHGLAKDASLADVKASIGICCLANPSGSLDSSCSNQPFDLTRPSPAVLSMRAPALNPGQRCIVRVKANPKVKDAFGLPLLASSDAWWSLELDAAFAGPSVRQVALLEPSPGNSTLQWPWVSRGTPEPGVNRVQAVSVPAGGASSSSSGGKDGGLLERALAAVLAGYSGGSSSIMSTAGAKVQRKDATWPTFQSLTLPGQPGISLVGTCCRQVSYPSPREALATTALVVQSDLQAAFVEQGGQLVAWVTTTQGESKPKEGARVQVYGSVYGKDAATAGPACITASDGTCVIDLAAAKSSQKAAANSAGASTYQPFDDSAQYSAVITAEGHGPLVVPDLPNSARYRSSSSTAGKDYVATLVLDRKLVKPGDELHVTGYVQRKEGSQLKVDQDLTSLVLQVSPGFDRPAAGSSGGGGSSRGNPTRITVKVDPAYGTLHAVIPVPRNATPATYNLQLWTPTPAGGAAANAPISIAEGPSGVSAAVAPVSVSLGSTAGPLAAPVAPATMAALSSAAAANVKAAGKPAAGSSSSSGRRLQARAAGPSVAVMPKPKQLMGMVPSDPGTNPAGVPYAAPAGLREPNSDAGAAADAAHGLQPVDSSNSSRRQLQQAEEDAPSTEPVVVEEEEPFEEPEVVEVPGGNAAAGMTAPVLAEPSQPDSQAGASSGVRPGFAAAMPGPVPMPRPSGATLPPLGANLAYTTFTVGDPRPPTASLALSSESAWVRPDGSVGVSVAAKSYVGSEVSGAEVALKWSTGKAQGEMVLKTNASGVASGTVELSKLPPGNRSEPGDSLALKATWIGPTREPLMQSKTVKIADGPVRVELQRTLHTNVPGVAFGVSAETFSNEDDSPVKGATVEVTLTPRNGSASLTNCSTAQQASLAQQKCSIAAGSPAAATACQLTLPCAGDFVLRGCVKGGANSGCSKPLYLGRNMTAWLAAPWSTGPGQVQLLPDRKNVSLGQDVALTLQNPFWGPVSALVVWGNGVQREQFFLDEIPPGPSTIVIQEIGPECRGGCSVVVTLAVARPKAGPPAGNASRGAPSPAAAAAPAGSQKPTQTPAAPQPSTGQAPRPAPASAAAANSPRGAGFKAPPAPAAAPPAAQATPRGLAGSAPDSRSGSGIIGAQQQRPPSYYSAGQADGLSSSGHTVRTFTGLWPFTINVHGLPPRRQRPRVGLFGNRGGGGGSSNRGLLRLVAPARNERGSSLAAAAERSSVAALPDIPRSKLYDPYAPITVSAQVDLNVPDTDSLAVAVSVSGQSKDAAGVAVLAPQSKQGSISVSVKDAGGAAVANAEVTVLVVDKAVLDLMPYELQDVSAAMQPKLRAAFNLLHLNALRVNRAAINATFTTLQRRLISVDPWLPVDTQVSPSEGVSPMDAMGDMTWLPPAPAVDISDEVYLRGYSTALTPMPYKPCPLGELNCPTPMVGHSHGHMAMGALANSATMVAADAAEGVPAPAPMAAAMPRSASAMAKVTAEGANGANGPGSRTSAGASAGAANAQLRMQQAFKVTPLFKTVKTGSDGKVTVDFPAPDNLGRFVVRAYVAAPKASVKAASASNSGAVYGAGESALVVRRTVSLVPSLPRQVRVSDKFSAGVLVEAPGTVTDVTVTVTATLQQPGGSKGSSGSSSSSVLSISRDRSRTVTLSPGKPQQEVRFDFTADSIGLQNITFAAAAGVGAGASRGGANRGLREVAAGGSPATSLASAALRGLKQFMPASRRDALPSATAGAVADQVQLQVPVNGKQGAVVIATSFAVRGSSGGGNSWQEGMVLPRAEQGSGSVSLVAGVGSLPAIQAAYTGLADQGLDPRCTPASQAVALSLLPAFLALYQQPGTSAASLLSAQQLQLTQAASTVVTTKLTHQKFGLLPVEPLCLLSGARALERADITLNAWAAWLAQQALSDAGGSSSGAKGGAGVLSGGWSSIQGSSKGWVKALETQLVADAVAARTGSRYTPPAAYSDMESLAWARLVLGPGWNPPAVPASGDADGASGAARNVSADVRRDLSMDRLTAAALAGNLTVGGRARVGLALLRAPEGAPVGGSAQSGKPLKAADAVQRLSKRLVGSIRVGGRTAYVATAEGARSAAGMSDQSMALTFLVESSDAATDNPLVQKLAAWVAQGAAPPPLFFAAVSVSSSPWDAALRSQALTAYDSSTASLTPDLKLMVNAQPKPTPTSKRAPVQLLSAAFTAQEAGKLASSSKGWDAVPPNSTLVFQAEGTGEVSVAAALDFTPADLLPFPTYRGLWVQRAVLVDQGAAGGSGSGGLRAAEGGVPLGKIVTLAVQVTTPDDQSDVVVEALMPGGLEPMDPNVFRDADAATICSSGDEETPLTPGGGMNGGGVSFSPRPRFLSMLPMMPGGDAFGGGFGGGRIWPPIWPVCPVQTTAPDRVSFRFSYMRAGTHTMRFRAVAATSGAFVLPPVKAFVQQQPEVMGLSPAGSLTVCPKAEACAAAAAGQPSAAAPAKACPQDCNGNGACNLATGTCLCDSGFGGVACADIATE